MTKDMTSGSVGRHIINFAIPLCLGLLFQQFYNMVDTMIVGKVLGVNQLAGVGATNSLFFLVIWFCTGLCNGFSILIAQAFGAKNKEDMCRYVANSVWLCVIFGALITVASSLLCRRTLILLNTPSEILEYAYIYILIIFLGIPCTLLYNMLAAIARALGDSKTPLVFLAISSVLNIGLDLICMIPLKMGVAGAAVATVAAQGISGLICLFYMKKKFTILKITKEEWHLHKIYAVKLSKVAVPMGLQYSITGVGCVVLQFAVNGLGAEAVAGVTAANKIGGLITCPIEALGQTMAPYTGQNIGSGKPDRVSKGVKMASLYGFIWSAICLPVLHFFGKPLSMLFLNEVNVRVVEYSFRMIMGSAIGYCLLTLVNVVRFSIQGLGHSGSAMTAGLLEMIARFLAGVVLVPLIGYAGVSLSNVLAWIFADLYLIPAFLYYIRKSKSLFDKKIVVTE